MATCKKVEVAAIKRLAKGEFNINSDGTVTLSITQRKLAPQDEKSEDVIHVKTEVSCIGSTGTTLIETNLDGLIEMAALFRMAVHAAKKDNDAGNTRFSDDYLAIPSK